jgi:hypothetical protein
VSFLQKETIRLFNELWGCAEKCPTGIKDFLTKVEVEMEKGCSALDAFKKTSKFQQNPKHEPEANSATISYAPEQSGKGQEMCMDMVMNWQSLRVAPVLVTMNMAVELTRHGSGIIGFNAFVKQMWELAGGSANTAPQLRVFQGKDQLAQYETDLERAKKEEVSDIPVYVMMDNESRVEALCDNGTGVMSIIERVMGTHPATGAVMVAFFLDEGDLLSRTNSGKWMKAIAGKPSLYEAACVITFVTATPAAVHFNIINTLPHKFVYRELAVSSKYWEYFLEGDPRAADAKAIKWLVGHLSDMVSAMAVAKGKQCALAMQSSVSEKNDIDKAAMRAVFEHSSQVKGFMGIAWWSGTLNIYVSDDDIKEMLRKNTSFFKAPVELTDKELGGLLQSDSANVAQKHVGSKKHRKTRSTANKRKRGRTLSEQEELEVAPEQQQQLQALRDAKIVRFQPKVAGDRDYSPFITVMCELFKEANKVIEDENELVEEAERKEPVQLKVLTFAKAVAGRARVIKAKNHEWPLDFMFLDLPTLHFEALKQAAGRIKGIDNRTQDEAPVLYETEATRNRHIKAILANRRHRSCLQRGILPLCKVQQMAVEMETMPTGSAYIDTDNILAAGSRNHTRRGAGTTFEEAHDQCSDIKKRKQIDLQPSVQVSTAETDASEVPAQASDTSAESAAEGGEVVQDVPAQACWTSVEAADAGGGVHPEQVPVPSAVLESTAEGAGM